MLPNASVTRKETEKTKEGLFSRFSKSESAAVTVIIAILLLGLVFAMISVVRLHYVPEWKSEAEQDHMYDIQDDMIGVKARIDILSELMESGNYSANNFSATVPFNLGGGKVQVFEPSKSAGKLEVNKERCTMNITLYNSTNQNNLGTLECGGISCYSENRQYPDEVFRYENGALILANGKNSIMKQPPAFTINETSKDKYTVTIRAVPLSGKPDSISSNTIVPLQLTGWGAMPINNSSDDSTNINAFNLTIATKYPDAWFAYFDETAQDQGLIRNRL